MKKLLLGVMVLTLLAVNGDVLAAATTEGREGLLPLGAAAPDFSLPDVVTGKTVSLADFKDKKALLVIVMCKHCPFVQRVKGGLATLSADYKNSDLGIVSVSANDTAVYPEDGPEGLKQMVLEEGFEMPVLFDESQEFSKRLTAVATPDFFLFDADRKLVYRGQMDGARPGNEEPVTGKDIRAAIEAVLTGTPVAAEQKPAVGCSIKWKKGNEPAYF